LPALFIPLVLWRFGAKFACLPNPPTGDLLNFIIPTMKRIIVVLILSIGAFSLTSATSAQENQNGTRLGRIERKAMKQAQDQAQVNLINELVAKTDFVLEPNQVSGFNVNPALNFVLLSGDTLIFQISSPGDRSRSNNPFTDKTVFGKVTSKSFKTDPKTGYHLLKLNVMTEVGIAFHVDLRIAPNGSATAWISPNNSGGHLDYQGKIVPWEKSIVSVGPESYSLTGFPWYYNPYIVPLADR
jgi:hypothetical protein